MNRNKLENIISGHSINEDDAAWLRALADAGVPITPHLNPDKLHEVIRYWQGRAISAEEARCTNREERVTAYREDGMFCVTFRTASKFKANGALQSMKQYQSLMKGSDGEPKGVPTGDIDAFLSAYAPAEQGDEMSDEEVMQSRSDAWFAVVDVLHEVAPELMNVPFLSGRDKAVRAIREFAFIAKAKEEP